MINHDLNDMDYGKYIVYECDYCHHYYMSKHGLVCPRCGHKLIERACTKDIYYGAEY